MELQPFHKKMQNVPLKVGGINTLVPIGFISKHAIKKKNKKEKTHLVLIWNSECWGEKKKLVKYCNQNVM